MNGKIRIGETARRLGVHPVYLRSLEKSGRIPEAAFDRAGRFYTEADLVLLKDLGIGARPQRLKRVEEVRGG